jgi:hypothetical protein
MGTPDGGGAAGEVCWEKSFGAPVTRAAMAAILPKKLRRVLISIMWVSSVDKPMLTNERARHVWHQENTGSIVKPDFPDVVGQIGYYAPNHGPWF